LNSLLVSNLDDVEVLYGVTNILYPRRQNAWINARENVLAGRNSSRKSSVAPSARLNGRNGAPNAVRMPTSTEWFRGHNRVKSSTIPDLCAAPFRALGQLKARDSADNVGGIATGVLVYPIHDQRQRRSK
jgi:hypothetical protein